MVRNFLFIVAISLAGQGFSLINSSALNAIDHLIDGFVDKKITNSTVNFNGLSFAIAANTNCESSSKALLNCRIINSSKQSLVTINFEHKNRLKTVVPLMRFMRGQEWLNRNHGKNEIVEEDYRVGVFQTRLQQYTYFRLDNIFWPVLIRAFDIVVDDKSIISVTTICGANEWPMIQKAVETIEVSFSRTAKK